MNDYGRVEWQNPEDADTPLYHSVAVRTEAAAELIKQVKIDNGCGNVKIIPNHG
jgi:hypothetical protein